MSFASLRARLPSRSVVVLVLGIAATLGYARFLGETYPVRDWLFWKIAAMWVWGAYLSLAWVSAGHLVLTRALRMEGLPTLEHIVHSAATGMLVFILGMYLGGFARLYYAWFAVLLPGAMIAAGGGDLLTFALERHDAWQREQPPRDGLGSVMKTLAMAFGVFGLIFVYLGAMTPEAINFDALWSHVPIAADYARAHRIVAFDADYTRNFPHLASIAHTWPMILPAWGALTAPPLRWMMVMHLELFVFLWTLAGVAAMAAWLLESERVRGTWAAFFLFPAIFCYDMNLGGAADHYLAFFAPPLFLAAVRAAPRFTPRACALAGAYAAGALLTKYQGVYLIFGVLAVFGGLWIAALVRTRQWRALSLGPLALAAAFVIVTSPHFLKNWVFYGNPMYPFMQDVFKSHPTTPHAAYLFEWLFKDYNWRPHGTFLQNVRDAIGLSVGFSFIPHYSFTHNVPSTGSLFTLCMPMALLVKAPRRIWLGYAAGMGALFAWAMIFRVDRHLQTFMPLLVATTAAVIVRAWELGGAARPGVALLVGLQVIWGGDAPFYAGFTRIHAAMEMIRSGYEGHARTRFDGFRGPQRALGASLPKDARVVLHMYRPTLGIDRDILLDWAGQQGLILYEGLHGPRDLYDLYKSLGVTHLIWIPGFRAASTKQEDVLFTDFVTRWCTERKRFGAEELITLPAEPPPLPDHPYMVLALGLPGYHDGLYPLESMKTYEAVPENKETFARPAKPLPKDTLGRVAMVGDADAVLVADHFKVDPQLRARIESSFDAGQIYPRSFSVYVHRGAVAAPTPPAIPPPLDPAEH